MPIIYLQEKCKVTNYIILNNVKKKKKKIIII
jgi:hypothetical protein